MRELTLSEQYAVSAAEGVISTSLEYGIQSIFPAVMLTYCISIMFGPPNFILKTALTFGACVAVPSLYGAIIGALQ